MKMAVEIWGARGSMPTPGGATLRYGGNTSCISVRSAKGDRLIVDAGTGIRKLGELLRADAARAGDVNLFFTHFHWDHIQGLPFFAPFVYGEGRMRFHAGVASTETRQRLARQMSDPFFTLNFKSAKAHCEFQQMANKPLYCGDLAVEAFPLNHPQKAWGYRIESGGATVVIATDLEHGDAKFDRILRERARGADLLIYDAQYTEDEYASKRGWGHSTPRAAAEVARDAEVRRLALFHHDPEHDDQAMDEIAARAARLFRSTSAAREGEVVTI